jgi:rare lipoprotein A (peptidoglycan hydrolase)
MSFYGGPTDKSWNGKPMKNGDTFDDTNPTIASNTRPMNEPVCIDYKNKTAHATVTDAGGFGGLGRIADASYNVAQQLGKAFIDKGHDKVRIRHCEPGAP